MALGDNKSHPDFAKTTDDLRAKAPPPPVHLEPGAIFADRYVVERSLGAGGMGTVYLARDRNTGQDIALKLLHTEHIAGQDGLKRLVAEGLAARQIQHPNIVAVFDIALASGQPYLAMEYVKGETLRQWLLRGLEARKDVPVAAAVGITKSILSGLGEAHRMKIVHRDMKPENVILQADPIAGDYRQKVLDFGIAKSRTASQSQATHSGAAGSAGTIDYMAPEQKRAAGTAGPEADIYSVAAMLYELLMGGAPQSDNPQPASQSRHDVPPSLDYVIKRGLRLRPVDRFASTEEFSTAIDQALKSPPKPEPKPEPPDPEPVPKSLWGVMLHYWRQDPLVRFITARLQGSAATKASQTQPPKPVPEPPPKPSSKRRMWAAVIGGVLLLGAINQFTDQEIDQSTINSLTGVWNDDAGRSWQATHQGGGAFMLAGPSSMRAMVSVKRSRCTMVMLEPSDVRISQCERKGSDINIIFTQQNSTRRGCFHIKHYPLPDDRCN
jgi:serine/threonine protein kinase